MLVIRQVLGIDNIGFPFRCLTNLPWNSGSAQTRIWSVCNTQHKRKTKEQQHNCTLNRPTILCCMVVVVFLYSTSIWQTISCIIRKTPSTTLVCLYNGLHCNIFNHIPICYFAVIMPRVNDFQKKYIIDFMEKYEKILFGRFSSVSGKNKKQRLWNEFVAELNNLGPPNKNAVMWKNVNIV